jgi:hypothetical protein
MSKNLNINFQSLEVIVKRNNEWQIAFHYMQPLTHLKKKQ